MKPVSPTPATKDGGRVVLGGGVRLPNTNGKATADAGKVTLGGGVRLPAARSR